MNKKMLLIIIIAIVVLVVSFFIYLLISKGNGEVLLETEDQEKPTLANPASVYCSEQGGEIEIKDFPSGQIGFCLFSDGSVCEEWDFLRNVCKQGQLKIETLVEGSGKLAEKGNNLTLHYTGTLLDGRKFDSSFDRNEPFSFVLGQGRVIQGWEMGVLGMKKGEKRKLIISPELAYGKQGVGDIILPNSVLVFEIELLDIK